MLIDIYLIFMALQYSKQKVYLKIHFFRPESGSDPCVRIHNGDKFPNWEVTQWHTEATLKVCEYVKSTCFQFLGKNMIIIKHKRYHDMLSRWRYPVIMTSVIMLS
jgi:hypothetical protein